MCEPLHSTCKPAGGLVSGYISRCHGPPLCCILWPLVPGNLYLEWEMTNFRLALTSQSSGQMAKWPNGTGRLGEIRFAPPGSLARSSEKGEDTKKKKKEKRWSFHGRRSLMPYAGGARRPDG
jgi:hypothetical protein